MANGPCGYAGSIKHSGAQQVKAPHSGESPTGKTVKKTGDDLRSRKSK